MKKLLLTFFVAGLGLTTQAQPPAGEAKVGDWYGEKISATDFVPLQDVAAKLNAGSAEKADVKVKAKIIDVCPKKGCWLTLELPNGETAMVKMKDYGFFLPLAAKGKTVVIDGEVKLKTTSVAELKHYAEDANKPKEEIEKITQPEKKPAFEAEGVIIYE